MLDKILSKNWCHMALGKGSGKTRGVRRFNVLEYSGKTGDIG